MSVNNCCCTEKQKLQSLSGEVSAMRPIAEQKVAFVLCCKYKDGKTYSVCTAVLT